MVIELRVVQFWSEIILVISNRTRTARSFDFEITRMISDQIALHSVQLPLLTFGHEGLKLFSSYSSLINSNMSLKLVLGLFTKTCELKRNFRHLPQLTVFCPTTRVSSGFLFLCGNKS